MQYGNSGQTWAEWIADPTQAALDDATKLAALREYIFAAAERFVGSEPGLDPEWMNKKLAALGVPDRIHREVSYTLRAPARGMIEFQVYGRTRAEAIEKGRERLNGTGSAALTKVELEPGATFVLDGPQDPDSLVVADAPTTVDATLSTLREIIMLAVIAGPRICESGANDFLNDFGLAAIPARQGFTVAQPATVVMTTKVFAYDEGTALRVAGWRWDNGQAGFTAADAVPAGAVSVAVDS